MKKEQNFRTDFLFPETDFAIGMGSVYNVAGNYFDFATSESETEADKKAFSSDWGVVMQDISSAFAKFLDKFGDIKSIAEKKCVNV